MTSDCLFTFVCFSLMLRIRASPKEFFTFGYGKLFLENFNFDTVQCRRVSQLIIINIKTLFYFSDTGIFIKVNCISTEFTPKKHGGEKGVPFRLQVETHDTDGSRIHAAGCILQVFKLKGADRKHKQDRDKINKRPLAEQEKFSPSFDCTVLADLPLEHIYVPANFSRPNSPSTGGSVGGVANSIVPTSPVVTTIEVAAQATTAAPLPLPAELQSSSVVETAEDPLENIHIEQHSMLFLSIGFCQRFIFK